MKGLIYKDLSLIGRQGKFFIVYIVLMVAIFSGIGDGAASMSSFMAVVCFMLSINCFAYDEQNGFDKLVAASPLPPMQVVLSRYASSLLLGLLGCLLTAGVSSVVQLVKGNAAFNDMLFGLIGALVAALVLMAILFPIFYKFGVNKSRIIMLLVVFFPVMAIVLVSKLFPDAFSMLSQIPAGVVTALPFIGAAVLAAALAASLLLLRPHPAAQAILSLRSTSRAR